MFALAARHCEARGSSLAKLAFQFSSQNNPFHTTMFSTARSASVQRNVDWYREAVDTDLLNDIRAILKPVRDKQWDFDAGLEKLNH